MANEKHVKMLKSGDIEAWNRLCEDNPGIVLDLSHADLLGADLSGAELAGANLTDAYFTGANLTGANLTDANLSDANLTDANLSDADLTNANLTSACLANAELMEANLTGANLRSANLTGADLFDASFFGANITNAKIWLVKRLTQDQINLAVFDPITLPILPEGFTLPKTMDAGHEGAGLYFAEQTLPKIRSSGIDEANEDTATPKEDIEIEKESRVNVRKHTLKSGEIWFNDDQSSMSCQVRDLTPTGARIKFVNEFACPKHVKLQMPGGEIHGPIVRAERIWIRQREVGLRFTDGDSFELDSK